MAGSFGDKKRAEFNIVNDISAARYVIDRWPTGVVLSPFELGKKVLYPAMSIAQDFGWTAHHPLVDAYKRYRPFPYDRPTWDLTSVYYAIAWEGDLLNVSKPGKLRVDEKGFTYFSEEEVGKHYVLSINDDNVIKLQQYFVNLIKQQPKQFKK
jgi:inosine-uridine nucleoside N-ribohydrolase